MKAGPLTFILMIFTFLSGAAANPALSELSFYDLSRLLAPEAYEQTSEKVDKFVTEWGQEALPHHVKQIKLRKSILKIRTLLDIFAHTFPKCAKKSCKKSTDHWEKARQFLDKGYELIGDYKDIWDVKDLAKKPVEAEAKDYTKEELKEIEKKREAVLDWLEEFQTKKTVSRLLEWQKENDTIKAPKRKKSTLSQQFWGAVDFSPQPHEAGLGQLRELVETLLKVVLSKKHFEAVSRISHKDILEYEKSEHFHDLRKKVRAVLTLTGRQKSGEVTHGYIEGLITETQKGSTIMAKVSEMVDRYGAINDLLTKMHRVEKKLKKADKRDEKKLKKKIIKIAEKISPLWEETKQWQKQIHLETALEEFFKFFDRTHSRPIQRSSLPIKESQRTQKGAISETMRPTNSISRSCKTHLSGS